VSLLSTGRGSDLSRSTAPRQVQPVAYQSRRGLAFKEVVKPVDLSFDVTQPKEVTAPGQSLVICHGLLYVETVPSVT